ncbi:hypothetical protein [Corynebacterium heidelbergense]|uniref:Uncharacterized protein n=1 Tax=Corynebacterium heidelbergense TaxID=2055947 RepID=A0A364VA13_9CORY|nr:hypothetical protein [Corynebacterium heidelbergense]RAV33406.1 hypothetical protein CWC39_08625 [Corynebacterium heidelbergense]WCZ35930.1 hypothetical protein CHEID_01765 [Corynebacterium heidelbergense]
MSERSRPTHHVFAASSALALLSFCISSCAQDHPEPPQQVDWGQVCVDQQTQQRVEDGQCNGVQPLQEQNNGGFASSPFLWYFLGSRVGGNTGVLPSIGSKMPAPTADNPVSKTIPSEGKVYTGLPGQGGRFSDSFAKAGGAESRQGGKVVQRGTPKDIQPGVPAKGSSNGGNNSGSGSGKDGGNSGKNSSGKSNSGGGFGGGHSSGGGRSGG